MHVNFCTKKKKKERKKEQCVDDISQRVYSLRLSVVSGCGGVTLLAGGTFVDVELRAERPQWPLFLKNTLKVDISPLAADTFSRARSM